MNVQGRKSGKEDRPDWIVVSLLIVGFSIVNEVLIGVIGLDRPTSLCLVYIAAFLLFYPYAGRGKINRWSKNKNCWTFRTWTASVLITSIFIYFIAALAHAPGE